MKYRRIKTGLTQAVEAWKPSWDESIATQPVEKAAERPWYLEGTEPRKTHQAVRFAAYAMAAIACFLVVFVSQMRIRSRVDAVVYLDVNPSISLEVNKNEKVLRAIANNADGEKILADMDLKGSSVDVAVNALVGSMFKQGYLTEVNSTVLLSIKSKNVQHAETLRQDLAIEIDDYLNQVLGSGSVYDQSVEDTDDLEDLAEQYHITPGKAFLILQLIEADSTLSYEELAEMNMAELARLLHQHGHALKEYLNLHGIDLDDLDDVDDFEDLVEDVLDPEEEDDDEDDEDDRDEEENDEDDEDGLDEENDDGEDDGLDDKDDDGENDGLDEEDEEDDEDDDLDDEDDEDDDDEDDEDDDDD